MAFSTLTPLKSQPPGSQTATYTGIRPLPRWRGLRGQLILMAVSVAVMPVLSVGGLAYWLTGQGVIRQSTQGQLTQTQLAAAAVQSRLESAFQIVIAIAALDQFTDATQREETPLRQQQEELNRILQRFDSVKNLAVLDNRGQALLQTDSNQPLAASIGDQVFVQTALRTQQVTMSRPTVSEDGEFQVDFAAPIFDQESNQLVGLVYLRLPEQAVQRSLEGLDTETQQWFLVNSDAQIVSSSDSTSLGQTAETRWSKVPTLVTAQEIGSGLAPQPNGQDALLSYAPIAFSDNIPNQTLGLLMAVDSAPILATSKQLGLLIAVGTGVAALLATGVAILVAQGLTRPIQQATAAVDLMQRGNFSLSLPVGRSDELGNLGKHLNQLGQRMHQLLSRLHHEHADAIQQQQQHWSEEERNLQADIFQIQQVLSALEAGNWATEAAVSHLPTAQIAVTLNRVIQGLRHTWEYLWMHSDKVNHQLKTVETQAIATVEHAKQQIQAAIEAQTRAVEVEQASRAPEQTANTHGLLEQTQTVLSQGRQDLGDLTTNLDALQQGTTQIVQRTQTLAEFVDLAAQFSKEQKRVASQTRVLALNASMLASRATGQQEPAQFATVAQEFESIAQQINDLAVEANQNLILLKQRSDQIQTVLSGLDRDVNTINDRVIGVTGGVGQVQKVFEGLETVRELVQHLLQSSGTTTAAAQAATATVQSLEMMATETLQHANLTQAEATQMKELIHDLQQQLRVFRCTSDRQLTAAIEETLTDVETPPADTEETFAEECSQ